MRSEGEAAMVAEPTSRLEARLKGRTLTDFVVGAAHDAAQRAIEEESLIRLSADDQRRFAEALSDPPAPNAALKRAKQLHRDKVEVG
jgi:uncharacterized protein (DUF1778 family)